ncbi:class I SAM-dependent methyltransferase [Halorientalis salina]|uniref:class I SAM-dependent methyltransferase n=1 Tax=Halorientalis salina TaxID=2932266 RepID=UPI0010AC15F6|nr:class I SAM-dependent methyltransferase [Halorientalis salina]
MGFHTFDVSRADALEDPSRYEFLSVDELLALLDPQLDDTIADLGSGTGFYTDAIAPYVETLYAVDVQAAMHDAYREKGAPENVDFVTAEVQDLPFDDDALDGAVSTMTYHEFASPEASAELARVIAPGGRLAIADWTAAGEGIEGPPVDERYNAQTATEHLEAVGFEVVSAQDRRETFVLEAQR